MDALSVDAPCGWNWGMLSRAYYCC